jgi:hypothetical protein
MKDIRITPIAFESLGVRSMCTLLETPDVKVLIDPGVALGPRFGVLPHPREYEARNRCRARIRENAKRVDLMVISHYHNDHYTPSFTDTVWIGSSTQESREIFQDKTVLLKDIRSMINFSQRHRGWMFQKTSESHVKKFEVADGRTFQYGETELKFSEPVFHGEENSDLGWVIMLTVSRSENKFMYASDVQGPISDRTAKIVLDEKPQFLIMGGPPLYLADFKIDIAVVSHGIENFMRLVELIPSSILEHHLLRAENWREFAGPVFEIARRLDHPVKTAAEFASLENNLLEYRRRRLYEEEPPSDEFLRWTKIPREKQRVTPPPMR